MRKKWLLYLMLLVLSITLPACTKNGRQSSKVESGGSPSNNSPRSSQQISASDGTSKLTPMEKQIVRLVVKRGADLFTFDDLSGLRDSGLISDIQNLLWVAPRGGAGLQPQVRHVDSKELGGILEKGDEMKDSFCSVRIVYEPYRPKQGMNNIAHKDVIIYIDPDNINDACLGVQNPDNREEWGLYCLPDYGKWLGKEVDLFLRLYTGL